MELGRSREAHRHDLRRLGHDLVCLGLGDALDADQRLLRRVGNRLHGVVAGLLELLDVGRRNADCLEARHEVGPGVL